MLALAVAVSAGCVRASKTTASGAPALSAESRMELAERVSAGWAESPRLAAKLMIDRYGVPDEVGSSRMIWHASGPWKRTVVRDLPRLYSGSRDADLGVIEQTVAYDLSPGDVERLVPFSRRLSFDPARMEMSSRADREEVNFLRLNLADDVLQGRIGVPEAKETFDRVLSLDAAGKTTRYLQGLSFGPGRAKTP